VVAATGLCLTGLLATAGRGSASTDTPVSAPAVWPTPQQQTDRDDGFPIVPTVGLVTGSGTDPSALALVKRVFTSAGVTRFVTASDTEPMPDAPVVVWVGGPSENAASAGALSALGIAGPAGLPADGYVLGIGRDSNDHARVVLSGADLTGTFYAAETLRQLVVARAGRNWLPGVAIRDWPSTLIRGVIEGFYGPPWSTADRLSQFDFFAATKQNTYVYSPKDDPYLRAQWRQPYPADQLAVIKQLVDRATSDHVQFTYALSPGLSICYSSDADEQALVQKFQSLWDIGVRAFAIPLDDISYTTWNCTADQAKWGTGGAAAGEAQAYLLNRVQHDFIDTHPGAARLEMVPTEYYNVSDSPYKTAIRNDLDSKIIAEWTGVGVVPATITADQAQQAQQVLGHDILVWDNYPVNDYTTDRLLLGPYTGREAGMTDNVVGVTANPMIEAEPSKIAEFTSGDYLWNSGAYDAHAAWLAGISYLGKSAASALKVFAENNYSSILNSQESPPLTPLIDAFWKAYDSAGDLSTTGHALGAYFDAMAATPDQLSRGMDDPAFTTEAAPWIDKLGLYGQAGRTAVDMLTAQRAGDGATAWKDRLALESLRNQLGAIPQTVAPGVMDPFLTRADDASNRWLGASGGVTPMTSMGTYDSDVAANMVDHDQSTFYWSNQPPNPGDYVGVDLGSVQTISNIDVTMSKPTSPDDYIHQGVLEYSTDGSSWTTVSTVSNQTHVTAALPAGTSARYVRLRAAGTQSNWVVVDEFGVTTASSTSVTGTPAAASGSTLQAAADGNAATAYVAATAPTQGDSLQVAFSKARPLDAVAVLQDPSAPAHGDVQVRDTSGNWHSVGSLTGGYTQLPATGTTADAVRIVWAGGTVAPKVYEVVPWDADTPPANVSIKPATLDVEAGGDAATATVALAADRVQDVNGTLTVAAPTGWTVQPRSSGTTVYRGTDQSIALSIRVPAGTTAKGYQIPITFTASGATSSATLTVNVHPRTSSTNVATSGTATASCVEGDGAYPQFDPKYAIDADMTTRWSSCYDDGAWWQVQLPSAATIGKVVLHWETAYGKDYEIQTSADGTTWTTAATVTNGDGGTDVVYLDSTPTARYIRMQGVHRATQYGYSLYEFEAYPVAS
jgi:hyaluronoglucosaminidase